MIQQSGHKIIADYYYAGDRGFWLTHSCIPVPGQEQVWQRCTACGRIFPIKLRKKSVLDEYFCEMELQPGQVLNAPMHECTSFPEVIFPCLFTYPSFVKAQNVIHQRCRVLQQKRSGYLEVECLDCGEYSCLAINSFSALPADFEKTNEIYCAELPHRPHGRIMRLDRRRV